MRRALYFCIFIGVLLCCLEPAAAQSFKSAKLVPVSTGVDFILSADLNGDGKPDLVFRPSGDFTQAIQVLLGNGDGTFSAPQSVNLPANNYGQFALADVNNDGKLDLIVVSHFSPTSNLAVLLGNGDGTFQTAIISSLPSNGNGWPLFSARMGVADFNGDGIVDIVIADQANSYLALLIGDNKGGFLTKQSWFDGNTPSDIQVADFNHDGHMDFVADYGRGATADVFLGNGDGTFQSPAVYSGPNHIGNVVVKDINGDGLQDLVTFDLTGSLQILLGNADGTFTQITPNSGSIAGLAPYIVDIQDFNQDGTLDVAVASHNGIGISLGQPNLAFGPVHEFPVAPFPYNVAVADFNKDGHTDFAVATPDGIALLFGNADGSFQSADAYSIGYLVGSAGVGDFNGDGIPDIAVAVGSGYPQILQGRGDGTFVLLPDQTVPTDPNLNSYSGPLSLGDFNGDHNLDLLISQSNAYLALGNGKGAFSSPTPLLSGVNILAGGGAYDLNGDGRTDVVLCDYESLVILMSQPDGTFTSNTLYLPGFGVGTPVFGDFNGDGKIDIAVSGYGGGGVAILLGNGDGTFNIGQLYTLNSAGSSSIALWDMDHDGKLDIILPTNPFITSSFQILYGNGDGTFQPPVIYPTTHPVVSLASSDMNEDSLGDLVVTDGNVVTVLYGIGNRKFGPEKEFLAGDGPYNPVIADLNGDGAPDLVFANSETNGVSIATVLLNFGPTKGSLSVTPTPSVYGQPIAISATFTPTVSAAGVPSGFVNFSIDSTFTAGAILQNGSASIPGPQILPLGTHTFTAGWPGDSTFFPQILTAQASVKIAPTNSSVTISPAVSVVGQIATIVASVKPPYQGVPTGTLQLFSSLAAVKSVTLDATGQLTYSVDTTSLALGSYPYSASYSGDNNFSPSTSPVAQLLVTDFAVSVSPASVTVRAGNQSGGLSVVAASSSGFNGSVDLSCVGLPSGASCVFSPPNLSLANAKSASGMLIISTPTNAAGFPFARLGFRTTLLMPTLLVLSVVLCLGLLQSARSRMRPIFHPILAIVGILIFSFSFLQACGGGSSLQTTPYSVQVQATVHGSMPAISRTTSLTVNVQH